MSTLLNERATAIYLVFAAIFELHVPLVSEKYFLYFNYSKVECIFMQSTCT